MNVYDELKQIMDSNPDLIFRNYGYEYLKPDIRKANAEAIHRIELILRKVIKGFVEFNNFWPDSAGGIHLRYQVFYNDERSFKGVDYIPLDCFKTINIETKEPTP